MSNARTFPTARPITNRSVTIATGGTAQQAAPANRNRTYLFIQNPSANTGSVWFSTDATAVAASPSIELRPGESWQSGDIVPSGAVSVIHATTGTAVTVKEAS